jgi:hypothetical protein
LIEGQIALLHQPMEDTCIETFCYRANCPGDLVLVLPLKFRIVSLSHCFKNEENSPLTPIPCQL